MTPFDNQPIHLICLIRFCELIIIIIMKTEYINVSVHLSSQKVYKYHILQFPLLLHICGVLLSTFLFMSRYNCYTVVSGYSFKPFACSAASLYSKHLFVLPLCRISSTLGNKMYKKSCSNQRDDVHVCIMCLRTIMNYQVESQLCCFPYSAETTCHQKCVLKEVGTAAALPLSLTLHSKYHISC